MPNDQKQSEGSSVLAEVGQTSSGDSGGNSAAVDQVFSMFKDFLEKNLKIKESKSNKGVSSRWEKKVLKIGPKIEWGRDKHKHFWSSWDYNFLSLKGMALKLIHATILDSRKILE